jgi:hypothetical protein
MLEIKELQYIISVVCLLLLSGIAYMVYKKFTTKEHNCPNCGNERDLERIKKAEILKHIPLMNLKHIKCYKCSKTHYNVELKMFSSTLDNQVS